jgi:hypothetical protein
MSLDITRDDVTILEDEGVCPNVPECRDYFRDVFAEGPIVVCQLQNDIFGEVELELDEAAGKGLAIDEDMVGKKGVEIATREKQGKVSA